MDDETRKLSYKDAGVNIDAANEAVSEIKELVKRTFNDQVLYNIGLFGGLFQPDLQGIEEPVLVSSIDGVGTKLKLAIMANKHDTVGIDLVSHCVNDILVQGAKPLFFLDYIAMGKLNPSTIIEVVRGLTLGCGQAGCALIGGETAEMPDVYKPEEYDLVGTIVGIVDRKKIVDGSHIQAGDVILGLASSGLHTNGYTLARKICFEVAKLKLEDTFPGTNQSVYDTLMAPHLCYSKIMQIVMKLADVRGMAHITGGGITENLPRILPENIGAEINLGSWEVPYLFRFLKETGNVDDEEMLRVFNMGLGLLFIIPEEHLPKVLKAFEQAGVTVHIVGKIINGERKVYYKGNLKYAQPN
ncbi:MAG TPA: phosphoribosylformylglycinamidine cyclo-ligase [Candidatus Hydrogenedens sp.]|nr:phosphoribosylformylglycinamidine cyclo-ligase [Candidatus Hydrogenedens sp.]HOL19779.1 phosphoribosylformylglycinamidine cyclo-ligase [Candidatus Hydrogenedens sp.]HPP59518.1 phosphoribosylformylglycinamidine cyclo-ligase [Candidatus Hydrogenedens sp.]